MITYINDNIEYNSFIYKWEDTKYGRYYIGSHVGSINDGYLFSGIDIKAEYKNRPSDFKRIILSYHLINEYHEIRDIEREYLIRFDVENNDSFYNRTNESYGGHHRKSVEKRLNDIDENGLNSFQRAAIKMVKTRKKKDSFRTSKEKEYRTKKSREFENIKDKISYSLKGSRWVNKNGIQKYVKKTEYDDYIQNGWCDGIIHSISYEECYLVAKENNIQTNKDWKKLSQKMGLPYNPNRKFKEWISWDHFLGRDKKEYTYEECSNIAVSNNIKSSKEWYRIAKDKYLPYNPNRKFESEWIDWQTFLKKK